jgi:hypothetical protein
MRKPRATQSDLGASAQTPADASPPTRRRRKSVLHVEPWPAMPEIELRQLARDIVEGHIVGTWMQQFTTDASLAQIVFMPIGFMTTAQLETFREQGVVHVWGNTRTDGHAQRYINGLPMFFSCHMLTRGDAARLNPLVEQAIAERDAFLSPGDPPPPTATP